MKLWEIFRFELSCQSRRASTWLYGAVLFGLTFQIAREAYIGKARSGGYLFNGTFIIAEITVLGSLMGLVAAAALAGDAATRDEQTRMHPLIHTAPIRKGEYLGGRFLAAFILHALILLAVPVALLLAASLSGAEPAVIGPFRPAAYLGSYFFIALPSAFVATAFLFGIAALSRRGMASYLGAVLLFLAPILAWLLVARKLGEWELAKLLDYVGLTMLAEMAGAWTPIEKSTRMLALDGSLLANRILWLGIAAGVLALTHLRFRLEHHTARTWWSIGARRRETTGAVRAVAPTVPHVHRTFGFPTRARQALAVAWESFREIVTSWGGLALAGMAVLLVMTGPSVMEHMGVPLFPTTERITSFIGNSQDLLWMLVPLLTVIYAGELVWQEREAGLSEISDAAPVPEWVSFLGKFLGLGLVLIGLQLLMMAAGMLIQASLGYYEFEPALYLKVLFGLQLADYLLFALLAIIVHVLVNQKYVGHMVMLIAYGFMAFGSALGIEHNMLVYGSDPGWGYSDMRGFGASLAPFVWFKLYWTAWALLLAAAAKLLWVRGKEQSVGFRLELARRRFTRSAAGAAAVAGVLILILGGFVFYNTNVLNEYQTASDRTEQRVEYERLYGQHDGILQPRLTGTALNVEIFPARHEVEIRGNYELVNGSDKEIDTVYLTTAPDVETAVRFDRPAAHAFTDERHGHHAHVLAHPLQPGDSLRLGFEVHVRQHGFTNNGIDASIAANGTFFEPADWLPAIGYQSARELSGAGERRAHGLPSRPVSRSVYDVAARREGADRIALEVVVGTDEGQVAVAPGRLRRTWTRNGRRYFHYATDAPISNDYAVFSAAYAVREDLWTPFSRSGHAPVAIEIVHHPGHAWNVDRMVRSVRASLDYLTEQFGPYPHGQIRLVEYADDGISLHSAPVNIWYKEEFALFRPEADPRELDFPFAVVAHEVAHQWWGGQVTPADVEGAPLLTESLAWYSAMAVVEKTYGREHLRRLLDVMRELYLAPRARADVPLLQANDYFLAFRKGPFAMHALREYVGEEGVNAALRTLLEKHRPGAPPLPTSLDLYRELQAVTPDSLQYLLVDLFEKNTFWELTTRRAEAEQMEPGTWQVTLDVQARKVVVDTAGAETELPMDDVIEIGVFAASDGGAPGAPLHLSMHRIRAGAQRIIVTVQAEPARAGIDPRSLLIDTEPGDNLRDVTRVEASQDTLRIPD